MSEPSSHFRAIFFELYESLPRQGPGNRDCAAKAIALCRDLPPGAAILDLGCGVGGQTQHLAELTAGNIVAMDSHAPSIDRLHAAVAERGLAERIRPVVGNMADPGFPPASFDLIWSEGALYNIGMNNALALCRRLLRVGGYLAFTDAVWRKDAPPAEIKEGFEMDYPTMGRIPDILAAIRNHGFSLIGHFTLPDKAWWTDFYTPMETGIEKLRSKYADDNEALAVLA
ncbi:SAM-dependent methyltransferase [Pseudodesulfovibrio alkaliphilus]|uniref:SAM-dependent methyltransferase n=1 Tax=Pseudodesulfovibrio alkaliphilus TaxID=2661613 RepID=UPI0018C87FCC|nr:class I SAM-dependent methyltransferase [Pseudodesulfovibrio alkaliphilus]